MLSLAAIVALSLAAPATLPVTAATAATSASLDVTAAAATGTGSISGKVTLSDGRPLAGGSVAAIPSSGNWVPASIAADGSYRIEGLAAGRYTLYFELGSRRNDLADYVPEFWGNRYFATQADEFDLAASQHRTGMNAELGLGATISGRVTLAGGIPLGDGSVNVISRTGHSVDPDYSDGQVAPDGTYSFRGVAPGNHTLEFWGRSAGGERYVTEYWGDKPYQSQATFIDVAAGGVHSNMDAELILGASVSGRLTDPDGKPVPDAEVHLESAHSHTTGVKRQEKYSSARTDENGAYTVRGVAPGLWQLYFYAPQGSPFRHEWWSDRPIGSGDPIRVFPQANITGKNAKLTYLSKAHPWGQVTRVAGNDRYATAARVSASQFAPGVPVAYIASGTSFPDALSAAPVAAASGGPILLSAPTSLPEVVADELRRLQPQRIVILGGSGAIDPVVAGRLESFTSGGVTRIGGTDRYATSAALSKSRFAPGVPTAYLVSGTKFPDALSAGPQAAISDGPILLTGQDDRLPPAIVAELKRLRPETINIVGGGIIGTNAYSQLISLIPGYAVRYSGRDRYETSALLSEWFDYGVSVAYVANGMEFPDALAAGPVAGIASGSVLLTGRNNLPKTVADELRRLRPDKIVILGGTGAVSAGVEAQLKALSG